MRGIATALLFLAALGCDEPVAPPPPPPPEDAGRMDATPIEAGPRRDAGPRGFTVDGVVGEREWRRAASTEASVATDRPGSVLTRLRAQIYEGTLYVAIEGRVAGGDVLVLYVDRALGEPEGVADPGDLTDDDPALDAAISSPLTAPPGFAADVAWGTTMMSRTPVGLDADTGWRGLELGAADTWIASELAPSACTEMACEAAIPLETLGGTMPRTIAMFARIVRGAGGWTNQTLPEDDPAAPDIVSAFLGVDEGSPPVDAGVPDAGPDAGALPIRIDGLIESGEWAAGAVLVNSVAPVGTFAGNSVSALYTLRDATTLYVAVEGTLSPGNAIVVYLDRDLGGAAGLTSPTPLSDFIGALDAALSKSMVTPAELRLDMGWGTLDMMRDGVPNDERMGWRDIGSNPSTFRPVVGVSACGASACETSVTLADLGVAPADDIGIFVRLVSATSATFSNQTIPADDAFAPELVSNYAVVPPP